MTAAASTLSGKGVQIVTGASMAFEFRLLGSFELLDGLRPVPLTAHKPRALLAMLVLHAGQLVPWHRMLDELWDGRPPRSAIPNLRTYATELRRSVFRNGQQLATEPGGYRLHLGCEVVDLVEFDQLCAQARRRHAEGELLLAESAYAEALRLWRGPPLAGLRTGPVLAAAATVLEERRTGVAEDYFEVRLDLLRAGHGGGPGLVADLRQHIAAFPLREHPRRQLMLALYRLGDVAGALASYSGACAELRESLGLDPDRELARLHTAILRRDPGLLRAGLPRPQAPPARRPGRGNGDGSGRPVQVAVCGPGPRTDAELAQAGQLGRLLARRGAAVLCGGEDGLVEAVAAGARAEHGMVVPMEFGQSRTGVLGWSADAVIVVGGSWGTLCEAAAAVRGGVPVVALGGWTVVDSTGRPVPGIQGADTPAAAVDLAVG
ncbi:BTAD domain-containing putative transcriptional regulator [Micromonosporaceae bacterium B7E4]